MNLRNTYHCRAVALLVAVSLVQRVCGEAPLEIKAEEYRVPGKYIVVLKDDVDVEYFTNDFTASVLRGSSQGKIGHTYTNVINGFSAQLSDNTLQELRESKHVKYIEEDGIMRTAAVSSWGLGRVDQRNLPLDASTPDFLGDGSNTHVYIVDSGTLYSHTEFSGRTGDGYDATDNTIDVGLDCHGHGTHCGGTAVGATYGIASSATVHSVRSLNCDGSGLNSYTIKALDWIKSQGQTQSVVSMSLGGDYSTASNDAVESLYDAGYVVSVAAGNNDTDACTKSPASATKAITVGATDDTDTRATFSNYGSCLDIFAPGVNIVSATNYTSTSTGTWSGTSMACPHVSGAAAALLSVDSALTPSEITALLIGGSTTGVVEDLQGSYDRLLYIGSDTCMARCNQAQDPTRSCQCDTGCTSRGDCCSDSSTLCDVQSCSGRCGSSANAPCPCDSECETRGDCCSDYVSQCFPASCVDRCGDSATSHWPCPCDDGCSDRSDCCVDYTDECVAPVCDETVTTEKTITSLNYPANYDNNLICLITINGPSGKQVRFDATSFDLEWAQEGDCSKDSLSIYQGTSEDGYLMGTFCGAYSSIWGQTYYNNMFLKFVSNDAVTRVGYSADITFVQPTMKTMMMPAIKTVR